MRLVDRRHERAPSHPPERARRERAPPPLSPAHNRPPADAKLRKRRTPPSFRFLGRKVYLGVEVVLISAMRQGATAARQLSAACAGLLNAGLSVNVEPHFEHIEGAPYEALKRLITGNMRPHPNYTQRSTPL
jgi:hypothetical protein